MSEMKEGGKSEDTAKKMGGDQKPSQAEKKADEVINPAAPGNTGTTPGTNADHG